MVNNLFGYWVVRKSSLQSCSMHPGARSLKEWDQSLTIWAQCSHRSNMWLSKNLISCLRKTQICCNVVIIFHRYNIANGHQPKLPSILCSVLSRYGVRSLPSVIIAHGSYAFWPLGSKDLGSLINFYDAVTGMPFSVSLYTQICGCSCALLLSKNKGSGYMVRGR